MHTFQRWQLLPGPELVPWLLVGTTWLTQRYQDRSQRSAQISARLEQLFGEFIDQARGCSLTR